MKGERRRVPAGRHEGLTRGVSAPETGPEGTALPTGPCQSLVPRRTGAAQRGWGAGCPPGPTPIVGSSQGFCVGGDWGGEPVATVGVDPPLEVVPSFIRPSLHPSAQVDASILWALPGSAGCRWTRCERALVPVWGAGGGAGSGLTQSQGPQPPEPVYERPRSLQARARTPAWPSGSSV